MLHLLDIPAALEALGDPRPGDFAFRNFIRRQHVQVFTNDTERPSVLLALRGANMMVQVLADADLRSVMQDLLELRFADAANWPTDEAREDWAQHGGKPYVFVNTSPVEVWEAGQQAGFVVPEDFDHGHPPANLYWWEGKPRFGSEVQHSCRLGRGLELWDRLRRGVGYDSEGEYVRAVLQEQPSFVCEVEGQSVCWSTIHLNGSMGMIYTPPEHRRHGYARSLASFQIDHQLRQYGFACCHVVSDNVASYTMLQELGGHKDQTQIVWRILLWPKNALPAR
jgi:hypothetical protein